MTKREIRPTPFFEETWLGAVVMLSIMFLSPIGILALLGLASLAKLISRWRARAG